MCEHSTPTRRAVSEDEWQRINLIYDSARSFGMSALYALVTNIIVFVGMPILFANNPDSFFLQGNLSLLFASWIGFLFSLPFGFCSFYLMTRGRMDFGHSENARLQNLHADHTRHLENSNNNYDSSGDCGRGCLILYTFSILLLILYIFSIILTLKIG